MKNNLKKMKQFYKKLTFLQGMVLAVCLSSIVSIAATNLPGFFVFSAGTPISSSEVNSNFEKLAGSVVFKGTVSTALAITNLDFKLLPNAPGGNSYRKRILFDNISITDTNLKLMTENNDSYSTMGSPYNYYEVPVSGWYEIRFIGQTTVKASNSICDSSGCSQNINSSLTLLVANSLSGNQVVDYYTNIYIGANYSQSDNDSDGVFENVFSTENGIPEIKRYYLKAGQKIFVKFESNYTQSNATADYIAGYPTNSIDLTIIKL